MTDRWSRHFGADDRREMRQGVARVRGEIHAHVVFVDTGSSIPSAAIVTIRSSMVASP